MGFLAIFDCTLSDSATERTATQSVFMLYPLHEVI